MHEMRQHYPLGDGLPLGPHRSSITFTVPDQSRKGHRHIKRHSNRENRRDAVHPGQSSVSVMPWPSHKRPSCLRVSGLNVETRILDMSLISFDTLLHSHGERWAEMFRTRLSFQSAPSPQHLSGSFFETLPHASLPKCFLLPW